MNEKIKTLTQSWQVWAETWKQITSPSRPTEKELSIFRKACEKKLIGVTDPKVLIMGATPELRDLLADYKNAEIVLLDINMEMILGMTSLTQIKNEENETWIKGNWIKAPLPEKYFDLILADFTVENLPLHLHQQYFENIHHWLKDDGMYAGRMMFFRSGYQPYSFDQLVRDATGKNIDYTVLNRFWATGVCYMGPMQTREVSVKIFLELINENMSDPTVKALIDKGGMFFPESKKWFIWNREEFQTMITKSFTVINEEWDDEVNMPEQYHDLAPIIFLEKN